jgi:hypothetical protein
MSRDYYKDRVPAEEFTHWLIEQGLIEETSPANGTPMYRVSSKGRLTLGTLRRLLEGPGE